MIEFFEVMFRALTGLKLTFPTLISLAVFFAGGYYFAVTTKRLNPIKAVLVLFLAYIIATVLSGLLGIYTLAVVLGFLSNQGVFLARVFLWAESLAEILFVMRHRAAYEDIRREESSTKPGAEAPRPPPNRSRPTDNTQQRSGAQGQTNQRASQSGASGSANWKPGPGKSQADIDKCLRILELDPAKSYTQKEIKKAYRRLAMIHHPDLPTGDHDAFVRLGMASDYVMKHAGA